jgi:hypothetical protein
MLALGLAVTFCAWMLQDMVCMLEQLSASGQHSDDDELSKEMQFVPDGQLKLLGRLGSTAEHDKESSCLRCRERLSKAEIGRRMADDSHKRRIVAALQWQCMVERFATTLGFEQRVN